MVGQVGTHIKKNRGRPETHRGPKSNLDEGINCEKQTLN